MIYLLCLLIIITGCTSISPKSETTIQPQKETSESLNLTTAIASEPAESPVDVAKAYYSRSTGASTLTDAIFFENSGLNFTTGYRYESHRTYKEFLLHLQQIGEDAKIFYEARCDEVYTAENCQKTIEDITSSIDKYVKFRRRLIDMGLINKSQTEAFVWIIIEFTSSDEYSVKNNSTIILENINNTWKIKDSSINDTLNSKQEPIQNLSARFKQFENQLKQNIAAGIADFKRKIADECNYIYKIDAVEKPGYFDSEAEKCYYTKYTSNAVQKKNASICASISYPYKDVECAIQVSVNANFDDTCSAIVNYNYTPIGYIGQKSSWDICYLTLYQEYRYRVHNPPQTDIQAKQSQFCQKILDLELSKACSEYIPPNVNI